VVGVFFSDPPSFFATLAEGFRRVPTEGSGRRSPGGQLLVLVSLLEETLLFAWTVAQPFSLPLLQFFCGREIRRGRKGPFLAGFPGLFFRCFEFLPC